jgi:hypothetical protein
LPARMAALLTCFLLISFAVGRTPKRETAPEQGVREYRERLVCLAFHDPSLDSDTLPGSYRNQEGPQEDYQASHHRDCSSAAAGARFCSETGSDATIAICLFSCPAFCTARRPSATQPSALGDSSACRSACACGCCRTATSGGSGFNRCLCAVLLPFLRLSLDH